MINIKSKTFDFDAIKWSLLAGSLALISACNDSDSKNKKPPYHMLKKQKLVFGMRLLMAGYLIYKRMIINFIKQHLNIVMSSKLTNLYYLLIV